MNTTDETRGMLRARKENCARHGSCGLQIDKALLKLARTQPSPSCWQNENKWDNHLQWTSSAFRWRSRSSMPKLAIPCWSWTLNDTSSWTWPQAFDRKIPMLWPAVDVRGKKWSELSPSQIIDPSSELCQHFKVPATGWMDLGCSARLRSASSGKRT